MACRTTVDRNPTSRPTELRRSTAQSRLWAASRQGLPKILDQVRRILDSHGHANRSRGNPRGAKLCSRHFRVRGENRKHYQRFNPAQACREEENLHTVAETPRRSETALHIESQHPAESSHLPL